MEVFEVVNLQRDGRNVAINLSETETKTLLTFAIQELMNRGVMTLLSEEERKNMEQMESLLQTDAQGNA